MTVPNENVTEVVKIKTPIEDDEKKWLKIKLDFYVCFEN
jgi:hypothetical protein